mmetsp:Transcript_6611/g.8566  ORF Transcript_6611/g.8566 Transcript_6611/m.8566 type:complete len:273 (-) Transcript_6611:399-1217(-)
MTQIHTRKLMRTLLCDSRPAKSKKRRKQNRMLAGGEKRMMTITMKTTTSAMAMAGTATPSNAGGSGLVSLTIRHRDNWFGVKQWWMVDVRGDNTDDEELMSQGASPLVARCMRKYGWDENFSRRVLLAYKQFLTLKNETQDWEKGELSPCCFYVDLMWHEHSSDLQNYLHDCLLLCEGNIVYRDPDAALNKANKKRKDKETRKVLKSRFGQFYDEPLWMNKIKANETQGGAQDKGALMRFSRVFCKQPAKMMCSGSNNKDHITSGAKIKHLD